MNEVPETVTRVRASDDGYTFSSRLFLTYILAGVAYVATDKSLYILGVAFIAWLIFTARLFLAYGLRGAWSLAGAPLALFWAYRLYLDYRTAEAII